MSEFKVWYFLSLHVLHQNYSKPIQTPSHNFHLIPLSLALLGYVLGCLLGSWFLLSYYESTNQGKSINKSNRSSLENTWSIFLQITRTQCSHSNSSSRRNTTSTPLWVGIVIVVDFILFNYTSIFFPIYHYLCFH